MTTTTEDIDLAELEASRLEALRQFEAGEAELASIDAQLEQANAVNGQLMADIAAHGPTVGALIAATKRPGEYAVFTSDPSWRSGHPEVVKAMGIAEGLEEQRRVQQVTLIRLQQRATELRSGGLSRLRGEVQAWSARIDQYHARQQAIVAGHAAGVRRDSTWWDTFLGRLG